MRFDDYRDEKVCCDSERVENPEDKKERLKNNKKHTKSKLKKYKAHKKELASMCSSYSFDRTLLKKVVGDCLIIIENTKDDLKNIKSELKGLKK